MTYLHRPLRLGAITLPNRIVMAPLGRARADASTREPTSSMVTYYRQRATAGLIVSEATHVSANSVSRPGTSAIHSDGQVRAWARVTDAVHQASGRIFQQLFHLGRKADPDRLPTGGIPGAPSAIAAYGQLSSRDGLRLFPLPRILACHEVHELVREFGEAAANAKRAGFDGVEIHGANGFLAHQFLCDGSNVRRDRYGSSIENRARFLLEVVDAAIAHFGPGRVGVRVSPHAVSDGTVDSHPRELFGYVAGCLGVRGVAYLHLIEPVSTAPRKRFAPLLHELFNGPLVVCGGFDGTTAADAVSTGRADLVAFGAGYIANPDLVERIRLGAPWNVPDPTTFYSGGDQGYIDYPTLSAVAQPLSRAV